IWGATFSPEYAQYLGLDYKETFKVILDKYNFRYLRLIARWDVVEKEPGKFDFTQVDYLISEAAKRQAKVVLAMGQKTPRWPECNVPGWTQNLSEAEYFSALNNYLSEVTKRYKNNSAVEIWQVENEPFLAFGTKCRALTGEKLHTEITTVKNIDPSRQVLVTDSGELSFWNKTATAGDIFGTTVYRVVWNKYLGYVTYDWVPSIYYRWRALARGRTLDNTWVAELQAEPWLPNNVVTQENIDEQFKSLNLDRLQKNLDFAQKTGFSRGYLWGVEWWYWLEVHGDPEIGDYMSNLNNANSSH
ncbi:MAG: endo-1,4-beta-xylanase, partial [Candidatus Magasanikbacteria bacterium]|nr:endo-1,4-beta-xylanase [Candidatus Magasanikbacteria bacterium]